MRGKRRNEGSCTASFRFSLTRKTATMSFTTTACDAEKLRCVRNVFGEAALFIITSTGTILI